MIHGLRVVAALSAALCLSIVGTTPLLAAAANPKGRVRTSPETKLETARGGAASVRMLVSASRQN